MSVSDSIKPVTESGIPDCEKILRDLHEWFGIEKYITAYIQAIAKFTTIGYFTEKGCVGFLTLEPVGQHATEIHVMGVSRHLHGTGIGKKLIEEAVQYARERGSEFLLVKTLSSKSQNKAYERTRLFYEKCGFRSIQELPNYWPENPCLLMAKAI